MHTCRGNFRSLWISQGGYQPVAEVLFHEIGVHGYFIALRAETKLVDVNKLCRIVDALPQIDFGLKSSGPACLACGSLCRPPGSLPAY
jgi:hypothetical protein